jgi:hypothetical protein
VLILEDGGIHHTLSENNHLAFVCNGNITYRAGEMLPVAEFYKE